jgi:DNA-binding transcriptional LysR family regulator
VEQIGQRFAGGPHCGRLSQIGGILTPDAAFDPATSDRRFAVGMSDFSAFVMLPSLVALLKHVAPSIHLIVRHTSHVRGLEMLERGEVDLIVGNYPKPPASITAVQGGLSLRGADIRPSPAS